MSEIINCPSCGAANQFPEGRTSMFCVFCGTAIQQKTKETSTSFKTTNESSIKTKPIVSVDKKAGFYFGSYDNRKRVDGGFEYWKDGYSSFIADTTTTSLSLTGRNIKSLNEITSWFSDNELSEIEKLDLSDNQIESIEELRRFKGASEIKLNNNKIVSLKGLERLTNVSNLQFSGNKIEVVNAVPTFQTSETVFTGKNFTKIAVSASINYDFSNNAGLKTISDDVIAYWNTLTDNVSSFTLNLTGCKQFDTEVLSKIDFRKITEKNNSYSSGGCVEITFDKDVACPDSLKEIGFRNVTELGWKNRSPNTWGGYRKDWGKTAVSSSNNSTTTSNPLLYIIGAVVGIILLVFLFNSFNSIDKNSSSNSSSTDNTEEQTTTSDDNSYSTNENEYAVVVDTVATAIVSPTEETVSTQENEETTDNSSERASGNTTSTSIEDYYGKRQAFYRECKSIIHFTVCGGKPIEGTISGKFVRGESMPNVTPPEYVGGGYDNLISDLSSFLADNGIDATSKFWCDFYIDKDGYVSSVGFNQGGLRRNNVNLSEAEGQSILIRFGKKFIPAKLGNGEKICSSFGVKFNHQ